jgi:hypothetical protein
MKTWAPSYGTYRFYGSPRNLPFLGPMDRRAKASSRHPVGIQGSESASSKRRRMLSSSCGEWITMKRDEAAEVPGDVLKKNSGFTWFYLYVYIYIYMYVCVYVYVYVYNCIYIYNYIYKRIGYYRVFQCMWICHWLFDQLHPISKDPSYPQGPSKLGSPTESMATILRNIGTHMPIFHT